MEEMASWPCRLQGMCFVLLRPYRTAGCEGFYCSSVGLVVVPDFAMAATLPKLHLRLYGSVLSCNFSSEAQMARPTEWCLLLALNQLNAPENAPA
jgi:hypothetical protein